MKEEGCAILMTLDDDGNETPDLDVEGNI